MTIKADMLDTCNPLRSLAHSFATCDRMQGRCQTTTTPGRSEPCNLINTSAAALL